MATTVTVSVGGQNHTIGCGPGEEERVTELAEYLDSRAAELTASGAQPSYNRLLLMTALMIADDLANALDDVDRAREQVAAETGVSVNRILAVAREFAAAPVFLTAEAAMAARRAGEHWAAPRCMTERQYERLVSSTQDRAGLISQERDGRHLIYRADFARMNSLLGYLTEHCCEGQPCELTSPGTCTTC